MKLTEIRVNLCPVAHVPVAMSTSRGNGQGSRLRAFLSLTFDDTFVIRDVKLIEGNDGLFLAMPSRKLCDHCPRCREKNHLRARFCNQCGEPLDPDRHLIYRQGNGGAKLKLHADVAHPINARCRQEIERQVVEAYWAEVEKSKQPGYVPPVLDPEDFDVYDARLHGQDRRPPARMYPSRPSQTNWQPVRVAQ